MNALASTRAPGKLVLSGAYSVLEGAPAIVAAVDRYATADGTRPAGFVTDEMRAAMQPPYPLIDASALREDGRKLGLGSSAALLVAALSATGEFDLDRRSERYRLFERALAAHRRAQGGGSGIDVAASTFGGTLQYQLPAPLRTLAGHGSPRITPLPLPSNLHVEAWQSPQAASTQHFISQVYTWRAHDEAGFEALFRRLRVAAERAVAACQGDSAEAFIDAVGQQATGLAELGARAQLPIVEPSLARQHVIAERSGAALVPAGAGGGDVHLLLSAGPASDDLRRTVRAAGLAPLPLSLGAPGVQLWEAPATPVR